MRDSDVLAIVQSVEILSRPWCVLEIVAAVDAGVPIVAIAISGKGYDFAKATNLLLHLDTVLDAVNPGACDLLRQNGVEPLDAAYKLSTTVPQIISLPFNSSASSAMIQASLMDIVTAMNTVTPMASKVDKASWLKSRASSKSKHDAVANSSAAAEHGALRLSDAADATDVADAAGAATTAADAAADDGPDDGPSQAVVPLAVPSLPDVMSERPEMLTELRSHLLDATAQQSNGTISLSSAKQSKVATHGQGGVGKTTMAAAIVHDAEIRSAFARIGWLSVGQQPAVMEQQKQLFFQLVGRTMQVQDDATVESQLQQLQAACIGKHWLVVLDDVWHLKHEKQLSCIDSSSASKLLVTTRIRGLLQASGCTEVSLNLLAPGEAADLLLRTGRVQDVNEAASAAAAEVAELCGNLPLYLSVCGGIILGYDGESDWQTELPGMLRSDRVGVIEEGMGDSSTVQCLVDSSLSMLKDEAAVSAFMALGVCPEDVLVKLPVAQLIVEAGSGGTAASGAAKTMAMRRSLKVLVDRHLLQGSISGGVQMHDIIRDLVRSRLGGDDGICEKQRGVVAAFIAACPTGGWAAEDAVGQYVEETLELHMMEALLPDPLADADSHSWLLHASELIVTNAATAIGSEALEAVSAAKEGAGDLVGAARVAWAARSVKGLSAASSTDLAFRAAQLLASANDPSCAEFELDMLAKILVLDYGSERNITANRRRVAMLEASGAHTFSSKWASLMGNWNPAFMAWSYWTPPRPLADVRAAHCQMRLQCTTIGVEASGLSDIPYERHAAALVYAFNCFATSETCDMDDWNPELCGGEDALAEAMGHWAKTCGEIGLEAKSGSVTLNYYVWGNASSILALFFGRVPSLVQWAEGAVVHYKELDLPQTRDFVADAFDIMYARLSCQLLVNLGRPAEAYAVLEAMGFGWSEDGFALYDLWFAAASGTFPGFDKDADAVWQRLLLYSASPQSAALNSEVSAWIPSPAAIAQHEHKQTVTHCLFMGMLGLAASAFLQLGRDDDAAEAARILVSPEHQCIEQSDLTLGHGVLGQVAAKRGDAEAADGHFGRALEAAAASRFPLWEVIVARDWKQAVAGSGGAAEAAIDAACAKMGKSRAELAIVL